MDQKLVLILMRHGKSSWADLQTSDHDRKLTKRGKRDAKRMGAALLDSGCVPDVVVSSSAKRARSTARRVAKQCQCSDALDIDPALYHDGLGGALRAVANVSPEARCVLLVGHNPTMEELVVRLCRQYVAMPTATVAAIEFDASDWAVAVHGAAPGKLRFLWTPRDLEKPLRHD